MNVPASLLDRTRQFQRTNTPLQRSVGPVTSSDLFKSPQCFNKPKSKKSLTSLLSPEARARVPSSLKGSGASLKQDIISLSTGRPSAEYFPLKGVSFDFVPSDQKEFHQRDNAESQRNHQSIASNDTQTRGSEIDLSVALSYSYSAGSEQLLRFVTEHVEIIHDPPYSDWQSCLTIGSTSALDLALRTMTSRGDFLITEVQTYSGALEAARPLGLQIAAVEMDDEGLSASGLRELLDTWELRWPEMPKPRILYTIPTGHNPTGLTQSEQRRRDIYAVAEQHDLFIIEDDPYYYLQFQTSPASADSENVADNDIQFLPSYLSLDTSGRVLRLDSTSKILAPGLRCAWQTGPEKLINHFLALHDVSVISPSGLSQLMMFSLLDKCWGHSGFLAWLRALQQEYLLKARGMDAACAKYLPQDICSWKAPEAGMFFSVYIDWKKWRMDSPASLGQHMQPPQAILRIEEMIHDGALSEGVLCCKGSHFNAEGQDAVNELYFRLTLATESMEMIEEGVKRLGIAVRSVFGVE